MRRCGGLFRELDARPRVTRNSGTLCWLADSSVAELRIVSPELQTRNRTRFRNGWWRTGGNAVSRETRWLQSYLSTTLRCGAGRPVNVSRACLIMCTLYRSLNSVLSVRRPSACHEQYRWKISSRVVQNRGAVHGPLPDQRWWTNSVGADQF